MFTIYVYTLDTMADWEIGYVTAELNSGRFFKKDAPDVSVKTVGISKEPIKTMGGLNIIPDCVIDNIVMNDKSVLLLPGETPGMIRNMVLLSRKRLSYFLWVLLCALSVALLLLWPAQDC